LLANVEAVGNVNWDKTVVDGQGKDARCHLTLQEGKAVTFIVAEDSPMSADQLDPPKPRAFQPEPYHVENANLLLVTSPTGIFNKHKKTKPEDFETVAQSELKAVRKVTSSVSFLDIDLPVSPDDITNGLLDDKEDPKVKLAVFGRGAFSSGKHHFKPDDYWN